MRILVPCDKCLKVFEKKKSQVKNLNFCCRECLNQYNAERFRNYNIIENPMNMKGRTLEQRFQMRNRRKTAKDRVGKEPHTYNKQLGETEHRKIMRLKLGRPLRDDEVVHHKDCNPFNNKPSNLMVMTRSEHTRLHIKEYWRLKKNEKV